MLSRHCLPRSTRAHVTARTYLDVFLATQPQQHQNIVNIAKKIEFFWYANNIMSHSDDDEEVKRAIAMSLADTPNKDVVDLTSDDEDDDMRRAIALSLDENKDGPAADSMGKSEASRPAQYAPLNTKASTSAQSQAGLLSSAASSTKPTGVLGLDRKAMEQERLARLGKRKRSASPERPSKQVTKHDPKSNITDKEPAASAGALHYPHGTVKRTWANKRPRSNDITIEEVLQPSTLNIAVLSAFQWDNAWLFENHLDPYKVKQVWIMSAKGEDVRQKLLDEAVVAQIPNFKAHFPPLPGQTINMHGKLMLLFHKDYLRVVVPTANMIKFDWGETNKSAKGEQWQPGVMENTVFLIDLPRLLDGPANELETEFGKNLVRYLQAQEVPKNVLDGVLKFDFSETKYLGFVHSM
jgi:hypothetical protein